MIVVLGASCSGKTHTVQRLVELVPDLSPVSASGLLSRSGRPIRPLTPEQAMENQWALLEALREGGFLGDRQTLLDGHATVETTSGPLPVPDGFFDALPIEVVVLVRASPVDIAERRAARGLPLSVEEAAGFQLFEREYAIAQAERSYLPLIEAGPDDVDDVAVRLRDRLSSPREVPADR